MLAANDGPKVVGYQDTLQPLVKRLLMYNLSVESAFVAIHLFANVEFDSFCQKNIKSAIESLHLCLKVRRLTDTSS